METSQDFKEKKTAVIKEKEVSKTWVIDNNTSNEESKIKEEIQSQRLYGLT